MSRTRQPETVQLDITGIGGRGDGLARWRDEAVFVPLTLPGDRVLATLQGRSGEGRRAQLVQLLQPGPDRVEPPCPLFGRCGGCSLQHLRPDALASWKQTRLATALDRAGLDATRVQPLIALPPGDRRRAAFAFLHQAGGVLIGFNERASTRLVEVDPCQLLNPTLPALLPALRQLLAACSPIGSGGEVLATLTDSGIDLLIRASHRLDLSSRERLAHYAETQDLARLSWQSARGHPETIAARRPAMVGMGSGAGAVMVTIPPGGFLQPSVQGAATLVGLILPPLAGHPSVADLYAGSGSFTFPLAVAGHRVHAVEGDADALAALQRAARRPGLGISSERRDLARRPLLPAELRRFDAVLFDPPRAGAAAQAEQLARAGPALVLAVSCNPATLARDGALLQAGGYRLDSVTPVDQFPWSSHLEAVAVFRR